MVWLYENTHVEQLPQDCVGFVYMIKNNATGRKYIGKKLAKFSKTTYKIVKLKNGNKKRRSYLYWIVLSFSQIARKIRTNKISNRLV